MAIIAFESVAGEAVSRPAKQFALPGSRALVRCVAALSTTQLLDAEKTPLWHRYDFLRFVAAISDQNSIATLRAGESLGALELLAHSYHERGALGDFRRLVTERLGSSAVNDDQRARYFLALAYAEEISGDRRAPLAGKIWIDRAIAAAMSDSVRCDCLEYLVIRQVWASSSFEALSIGRGIRESFASCSKRHKRLLRWVVEEQDRTKFASRD